MKARQGGLIQEMAARTQRRQAPLTGVIVASSSLLAQLFFILLLPAGPAAAAQGALDPGFGTGGAVVSPPPQPLGSAAGTGVAVLPTGQIAASGGNNANSSSGALQQFEVSLYTSAGAAAGGKWPVLPFSGLSNVSSQARAVATTPAGNIVAAGWRSFPGASSCASQVPVIVELTPSGDPVSGFPLQLACPSGATNAAFNSVAIEPDGAIVAAGTAVNGTSQSFVAWVAANGQLGSAPTVQAVMSAGTTLQSDGLAVAAPVNGEAYVAGDSSGVASVAAVTKTSGPDVAFNSTGVVTLPSAVTASGIANGPAGTLYVDGVTSSGGFLAQLDRSTGGLKGTFGSGGTVATPGKALTAVAYQPIGNIVNVAGTDGSGNASQMTLEQFDGSSGNLNSSFGSGGVVTTAFAGPASAEGVAPQPDGKLVAVGGAPAPTGPAGTTYLAVIRLLGPQLGPAPRFAAFQAQGGDLMTLGPQGWTDWGLGLAAGTSPSMIALPNGGYEIAFQAYGGALWTVGTAGWTNWGVGMAAGTSPSMIALPNGGFEVGFQAYGGALWSVGTAGWVDWGVGMAAGTSPSMMALPNGGYEIAFQAYGGALWTVGTAFWTDWGVGMAAGTSPSIIALPNRGYEIAFQAYGGALWSVGTAGWVDWGVGMAAGTSPSMMALPNGGFEIAFQAYGGALWTVGTASWVDWGVGMAAGTSPSMTGLPNGGYEITFQAYGGALWTVGTASWTDWRADLASGTNPITI